jgi:hypothetical protein
MIDDTMYQVNYVFVITIFPAILAVRTTYGGKAESTPCTAARGLVQGKIHGAGPEFTTWPSSVTANPC